MDEEMAQSRSSMTIDEQAAEWFARMRGPEGESHRVDFDRWYAVAAHADAYDHLARIWDTTKFLANTPTGQKRNLELAARRPWRKAGVQAAVVVVGMALLGGVVVKSMEKGGLRPAPLMNGLEVVKLEDTPRTIALPDGSKVTLDRGARLQLAYSAKERRLRLSAGRARFEVAHEAGRRFVVDAGPGSVTAHGTVFDVRLAGEAVNVALLFGSVEVSNGGGPASAEKLMLRAGEKVELERGHIGHPGKLTRGDGEWPRDMLAFRGTPLPEALRTFNRTSHVKIQGEGPGLEALRLTGAFARSDAKAFASQVAGTFKLALREAADGSLTLQVGGNSQDQKKP